MAITGEPYIPQTITVHLGYPNSGARNVTVSFPDYIKNVASSEIYPTWPESAIRANLYAQISYALNRVYTEYYRARGYDFDITNTTQYDQSFVEGRDIFDNISELVDELFTDFVRRIGSVEPYFTQYCNGTTTTCDGLSQWGTVDLAQQGYVPYEILTYYYGDDIEIATDTPVRINTPSYPGVALTIGSANNDVLAIQNQLNRISRNYPLIPKIYPVDGIYGPETQSAVSTFQGIFNLPRTGIVDKATWYKIAFIYSGVKRLSELNSEGISLDEISKQYPEELVEGMRGDAVKVLQYYLRMIAAFYPSVRSVPVEGVFGPLTKESVESFQLFAGLPVTGVVDSITWEGIYRTYKGIIDVLPPNFGGEGILLYPGYLLKQGMEGPEIRTMQEYLILIAEYYPDIPKTQATGYFGTNTYNAVRAFQQRAGLSVNGIVGPLTWDAIATEYENLRSGSRTEFGQYPGYILRES